MKKYQVISGKCFCKEDKISNSKTNEQINKQGLLQAESSLESIILEEQGLKRAYCSYIVFEELRKKYGSVNLFYFGLFCGIPLYACMGLSDNEVMLIFGDDSARKLYL